MRVATPPSRPGLWRSCHHLCAGERGQEFWEVLGRNAPDFGNRMEVPSLWLSGYQPRATSVPASAFSD